MSTEVFIISIAHDKQIEAAIRHAVEAAGLKPTRVQDVIVAGEPGAAGGDLTRTVREAGLSCASVGVSSSLRATFFAAEAVLSGDVDVIVVAAQESEVAVAAVLGGAEEVGRWNLLPRARIGVRSLKGTEIALRMAAIAAGEVSVTKEGDALGLVRQVLDELEGREARWGIVSAGNMVLLLERV
jgi:acetyl-CoA acetyltransferase